MKISVVIPLYNKRDYIERCLYSIIKQISIPEEIIVVDDGSTDDSAIIVSEKFPQVTLIHQLNAGVSAARNTGVLAAKYDYIAFLDADDFWEPDFLYTIHRLAAKYPSAGVYCTHYGFILENGSKHPAKICAVPTDNGIINDYFKCCIQGDLPLTASSVCINRDLMSEIGGFPLGMKMGEDQVVWSRLSCRAPIAYDSQTCVYYDQSVISSACHTNSVTQPAPQLAVYQDMLHERSVPDHLVASLKKLMQFTVLSCVKNNLLVGERSQAYKLLVGHASLRWDIYRILGFCMLLVPSCIFQILNKIRRKLR